MHTHPIWQHNQVEGLLEIEDGKGMSLNARAAELLNIPLEHTPNLALIAVVRNHKIEEAYLKQEKTDISSQGRILQVTPCDIGLSILDITDLRNSQEHARELLAVLSHELRTPVTTIHSTIEALHYDLSTEKRQNLLERATTEVERLTRLLDDLTVDVKPPILRRLSLNEHIDRAEILLSDKLATHQITLKTQTSDTNDYFVYADSDKLLQVLINLVENAAVHGPDGAIVEIKVKPVENMLSIDVIDQGQPLESSSIEQLFEPHSRGDSNKTKSTGLGLYIVRNIANYWGGEAWGHALEHGNSFGFSVPLV